MMKHAHFIGIGGSGLSAIARVLLESGYWVSGSDRVLSPLTQELADVGVQVYEGHQPSNIAGADLVIRSSAVPDDNPEVIAAQTAGIPVYKRADFLGKLLTGRDCIAIAGTHGKTTTTAMVAWVLTRLSKGPSYIIGGTSKNLRGNAHAGQGKIFVIEADEYDNMFLGLNPRWALVNIVEHDHPDCFPTPADYEQAFRAFVRRLTADGTLLVCQDDAGALSLLSSLPAGCQAFTFGLNPAANYTATDLQSNAAGGLTFTFNFPPGSGTPLTRVIVALQVPGEHNVRNACGVLALAHQIGLDMPAAAAILTEFTGTGRRFDLKGEIQQIALIDDYAHHPTEIRVSLAAARQRYPGRRLWAVWQPHTYSRTQTLQPAFAEALKNADQVIITEVYPAREKNPGYSADTIVKSMKNPAVRFAPTLAAAEKILLADLIPGDVVLVLSAGDADQINAHLLAQLTQGGRS